MKIKKLKWTTMKFNYTPPTESELEIDKIESEIKTLNNAAFLLQGIAFGIKDYRISDMVIKLRDIKHSHQLKLNKLNDLKVKDRKEGKIRRSL